MEHLEETEIQTKEPKQEIVHQHLPIANIANLMKETLDHRILMKPRETVPLDAKNKKEKPPGKREENQIKISKEAKEITQECVTELLHFITGEAFLKTKQAGR